MTVAQIEAKLSAARENLATLDAEAHDLSPVVNGDAEAAEKLDRIKQAISRRRRILLCLTERGLPRRRRNMRRNLPRRQMRGRAIWNPQSVTPPSFERSQERRIS